MKVVISGYYGFDNTGDEAVLDAIVEQLITFNQNISITVLSADPKNTAKQYRVNSIYRYSIISIIREIIGCDALISGGGSLFQDVTGRFSILYYLGVLLLAKIFGKKYVVLGQGYGPVKSDLNKWLVGHLLNSAALITVRDEQSLEELNAVGVTKPPLIVAADPVYLLSKNSMSHILSNEGLKIEGRSAVGVCIRPPIGKTSDFHIRMAKALDLIIDKYDVQVLFIPFKFPDDVEESAKIAALMGHKSNIITHQYSPKEMMALIASLDILIGMRLHSLIFALTSSVPVIGIDYDPKVSSLLEEFSIPGVKPDFSVNSIVDDFDFIWRNRQAASKTIKGKVELKKEMALSNFKSFFDYTDIRREISLFGIKINNITLRSALYFVDEYIKSRKPHIIFTPNPEIIMSAQNDDELKKIINSADLGIPDGIGVVAAAKLLGNNISERVTGIDLMTAILNAAREKKYKIFLLGSAPGIAQDAANNLKGVNIVGTYHGYFKDSEDGKIINIIKTANPDILFVGLGSPRQEKWLYNYCKKLDVPVSMVVGGSMDVLSGKVKRAPQIVQNMGVEWFYRLAKEPKRWRRQLNLVKFMGLAIKHRIWFK